MKKKEDIIRKFLLMLLSAVVVSVAAEPARADYTQLAKLTASDANGGDRFGCSVAISGTTALVGAYQDDDGSANSGSAYLYDFNDPCNITEIKLTASDANLLDDFGWSVAISGTTAIVGAYKDNGVGTDSGSAYLYNFNDPCNITETKLTASDATSYDYFGYSVALDGTNALVGAYGSPGAGSAYLYRLNDPCNIIETELTTSDANADLFGYSVALDGTTALVGARWDDDSGSNSGSAYLFDFSDPCNIIETKLTASDAAGGDFFGESVAISGTTALVGAFVENSSAGSAYLYNFSDPCNITETKLTASDANTGDQFGISVALDGSTAIVGAHWDDHAGDYSGSAYLFGPCPYTIAGDINLDCRVDFRDFALMADNWLVDCLFDPSSACASN